MSQSAGRATWGALAFIAVASTILSLNPVRQVTGAVDGLGDTACLNGTTGQPLPVGTECSDGFNCTYDETCQLESGTGKIRCRGLLNNTYCDAGDACTSSLCNPPYVYSGGGGASGCTAPTPYKTDCSALNTTCASFACDPSGTENNCANSTAQNEGEPCDDLGLVKCTVQFPASCTNGNCTSAPDADGDTICDGDDPRPNDLDPSGYFYDEQSARIVPGGHVAVTCQPGSATLNEYLDGSTGQYLYVLTNITAAETCRLDITAPPGCALSKTCLPQTGTFNAPSIPPAFFALGNYPAVGDPTRLSSAACTPWYDTFRFEADDADVINNNIPVRCPDVKAPTVSRWGLGAMTLLLLAAAFGLLRRHARQA